MLEYLTGSVLQGTLTLGGVLLCTAASLVLGLGTAGVYMIKNSYSKSFVVTLALLPAIVQVVIMLVNGNVGAGVAVAGAFSLVRFRSVPGNARDIGSIFFAMAIGLACGMGYLLYAALCFVLIGAANLILSVSRFGDGARGLRALRVTIPENMDYEGLFDDLFEKYTSSAELDRIKSSNLGSLFELTYLVTFKTPGVPKAFLDEIRCRNGNLNIMVGRMQAGKEEL